VQVESRARRRSELRRLLAPEAAARAVARVPTMRIMIIGEYGIIPTPAGGKGNAAHGRRAVQVLDVPAEGVVAPAVVDVQHSMSADVRHSAAVPARMVALRSPASGALTGQRLQECASGNGAPRGLAGQVDLCCVAVCPARGIPRRSASFGASHASPLRQHGLAEVPLDAVAERDDVMQAFPFA
jgi:hypothetical protein